MKMLLCGFMLISNVTLIGMEMIGIKKNLNSTKLTVIQLLLQMDEKQDAQTPFSVPSLEQLAAEKIVQHELNYEHIPQECKTLIKEYSYYTKPLTKHTLKKILSEAMKRGDATRLTECNTYYSTCMGTMHIEECLAIYQLLKVHKNLIKSNPQ